MGLLDGGLAQIFYGAFSGIFLDSMLHRRLKSQDDGTGGGSGSGFASPEPVKAQLDAATEGMRAAEGFVETDQRIIVLAFGIAPITTDDEITCKGRRWSIAVVSTDPATAAYELHGRLA